MADWEMLNIEPTGDKDEIKAAYYRALPHHHPEEDPEGFARLRESYERLMREANEDNESEIDDTPVGRWMEKVREAYEDFGRRICPETWLALLHDDVCVALDSAEEASCKLLAYFMDHSHVPHECLAVLEGHFNWEEKRDELCEQFPENFIDYILANSKYPDQFRYCLFQSPEPGKDYDPFLNGYYRMQNMIEAGELDQAEEINQNLKQMGIDHPDYIILQIRLALSDEQFDLAKGLCERLTDWRPNDRSTWYCVSRYHMAVDEPEQAIPLYQKILASNPEYVGALVGMGDAVSQADLKKARKEASSLLEDAKKEAPSPLNQEGEQASETLTEHLRAPSRDSLEEALSYYKKAEDVLPYDSYILNCIHSASVSLTEYLKQDCQEHPEDPQLFLSCARLLEETGQYEEGKKYLEEISGQISEEISEQVSEKISEEISGQVSEKISEEDQNTGEYLLLMGDLQKGLEDWDSAASWYEKVIALPRQLQIRLPYANLGFCRMEQKRFEEALDLYEKGLERYPDDLKLMYRKAAALNKLARHQEALDVCDQILVRKSLPNAWHFKAEALYSMGEYGQALDACRQAISILAYPETYLILLKIYYGVEQYERVLEIAQEMKAQGMPSAGAELYAMRSLRALQRYDKARELADQIMEQEPDNAALCAEVYYQLAFVEWDEYHLDQALELAKKSFEMTPEITSKRYFIADIYREKRDYRKALAIYSSMLKQNPQDGFSCFKIAEMYHNMDDPKRAERYYRKVLEIDPKYQDVHYRLAGLLEEDIRYEEALEEIDLQLELGQHELYFSEKSDILHKLDRKEEAIAILKQALEIYPSESNILTDLAFIYMDDGRYREAADCLEKVMKSNNITVFTYEWLVECLKQLGDNERREEVLNEGIEEFSEHFSLYYQRAELWRDKGQYDRMAEDGKKYVQLADHHMEAYLETGDAYYLMGDHDEEAMSWYVKGLEIHPDAWALWQAMGLVYRDHMGDCEKAIDCLEKALKYRNEPMYRIRELRILLGQLIEDCEKQGDKKKMQKYVKSLLDILLERSVDEYDAEMFRQIGNCYWKLGKEQWAKPYLERAENQQICQMYAEQSDEALFDLGVIQEELGQEKEALEYYQRALDLCQYQSDSNVNPCESGPNLCQCEKYEKAVQRLTEKEIRTGRNH